MCRGLFFFSSRRRHTRSDRDWSSDVCSSDLTLYTYAALQVWSQAVAKVGTTDPKKVMDTIKAGAWDTVIGKMELDSTGDSKELDYVVYKWDAKGNYSEINPKGS